MGEDERRIRDLIAEWMRATKAGEIDKVLGLMADDVVFLVPGQKPFGKPEFAAASRAMHGQVTFDGSSTVEEVVVAGDWAFCRTHIRVTAATQDGRTMRRSGCTLSVMRREPGGNWVLARDANLLAAEA
ncbi:MAG: SgcJ/EcaC family oxidoreductase [Alphaproteobacteria bacterium]|nr:SgcJ/EcaC family oxidoreductase [Alphaproteobacteria bacterium]